MKLAPLSTETVAKKPFIRKIIQKPHSESKTFFAAAAEWFYPHFKVFLPVIIGQFLTGFYGAQSDDEYPSAAIDCLAIGRAGVIDIARRIETGAAIYLDLAVHIENILVVDRILGAFGEAVPDVFDHGFAFFDKRKRDQPKASSRSLHAHIESTR
ncbi:MAG: hypothetical protein PHT88_01685 [Candidatus Moranbacteria bacterium]|nr:hypothetical protein [Candidatus Moranbacteria bacterium]